MSRYKLEMDSWPLARIEARVANIMKDPKKEEITQPYECNPYADQRAARRRNVSGTIDAKQLQDMMVPDRRK